MDFWTDYYAAIGSSSEAVRVSRYDETEEKLVDIPEWKETTAS